MITRRISVSISVNEPESKNLKNRMLDMHDDIPTSLRLSSNSELGSSLVESPGLLRQGHGERVRRRGRGQLLLEAVHAQ